MENFSKSLRHSDFETDDLRDIRGHECEVHRLKFIGYEDSVLSRRFPALRQAGHDTMNLILSTSQQLRDTSDHPGLAEVAEENGPWDRLFSPRSPLSTASRRLAEKTPRSTLQRSSALPGPPSPSTRAHEYRQPFVPCNPQQAKKMIAQVGNVYVNSNAPFDGPRQAMRNDRLVRKEKMLAGEFYPCAPVQAKDSIAVKYYLNSQDSAARKMRNLHYSRHGRQNRAVLGVGGSITARHDDSPKDPPPPPPAVRPLVTEPQPADGEN
eukprot:Rmarinus@m.25700